MNRVYWIVAIGLVALAWGLSGWAYLNLPESIPIHWNLRGQVDGHGTKATVFLMPVAATLIPMFIAFLPVLSPRKFEVDSFRSTYLYLMAVVVALFVYLQAVIMMATFREIGGGPRIDLGRDLMLGLFVFFGLMGNVMGKIRKNFYIGIRVPWTLASDRVWNDTHRLAAWLMVAGAVVGLLLVVAGAPIITAFAVLMISTLAPVFYSFFHYKALERRGAL